MVRRRGADNREMWATRPAARRVLAASAVVAAVALVPVASTATSAVGSTGFFPQSIAVLGSEMWALGVGHCRLAAGCSEVMHSTDGGLTFTRVDAAPARQMYDMRSAQTPNVFFADARDGYVFTFLDETWATHDVGRTWNRLPFVKPLNFAAGTGSAYAITATCGTRCTNFRFHRSNAQTDRWTDAPLPAQSDSPIVQLVARGTHVWIVAHAGHRNTLARSADGGRTFTSGPSPCRLEYGGDISAAPDGSLWVICSNRMSGRAIRSTDGGAHFRPVELPDLANSAQLGGASARVAVVVTNAAFGRLRRTNDGGRRWRTIRQPPYTTQVRGLAFGDTRHGVLLQQTTTDPKTGIDRFDLWRTTDGGAHWSPTRFP